MPSTTDLVWCDRQQQPHQQHKEIEKIDSVGWCCMSNDKVRERKKEAEQ